jgi:hypothetical protein
MPFVKCTECGHYVEKGRPCIFSKADKVPDACNKGEITPQSLPRVQLKDNKDLLVVLRPHFSKEQILDALGRPDEIRPGSPLKHMSNEEFSYEKSYGMTVQVIDGYLAWITVLDPEACPFGIPFELSQEYLTKKFGTPQEHPYGPQGGVHWTGDKVFARSRGYGEVLFSPAGFLGRKSISIEFRLYPAFWMK